MVRPKEVLVGHRTFEIKFLDEAEWAKQGHSEDDAALIEQHRGIIWICTQRHGDNSPEEYLREALFHEILHAVAWVSGWRGTYHAVTSKMHLDLGDLEEWIIVAWSPMLVDVLQTNVKVRNYLFGAS